MTAKDRATFDRIAARTSSTVNTFTTIPVWSIRQIRPVGEPSDVTAADRST
jgi:hypothetical protein